MRRRRGWETIKGTKRADWMEEPPEAHQGPCHGYEGKRQTEDRHERREGGQRKGRVSCVGPGGVVIIAGTGVEANKPNHEQAEKMAEIQQRSQRLTRTSLVGQIATKPNREW